MICAIKGKMYAFRHPAVVVLCPNGLMYEVFVTQTDRDKMKVGDELTLLTWVKRDKETLEDSMYGFVSDEQRRMFMDLISVSGVGPKTAMTALGFPPEVLRENIGKGNWQFFKMLKGVGINTAKKIILELQKKYWENDG